MENLRNLFEKCDPQSPFFDPSYSKLRLMGYPYHFLAVDERALDECDPRVIVASDVDFYHPTGDLGWQYGLTAANEAYSAFINVEIANMGLIEVIDNDARRLWLSDLSAFAVEDRDDDDDEEGGDDDHNGEEKDD